MLFEIQRACPRPGQSRVIASGPAAIKTLAALTSLRPNTKIEVIPAETKKDEFGSMPDLRGPVPEIEPDEDEDDIMYDPDIQEMVENGEHTCHMFDAPCQACEDDEEDEEDEEDEDDITLAELKEQLEDNMTLAELQGRLLEEEEEEEYFAPIEWIDEATYHSRTCGELLNF
jgi:hypothetical protein